MPENKQLHEANGIDEFIVILVKAQKLGRSAFQILKRLISDSIHAGILTCTVYDKDGNIVRKDDGSPETKQFTYGAEIEAEVLNIYSHCAEKFEEDTAEYKEFKTYLQGAVRLYCKEVGLEDGPKREETSFKLNLEAAAAEMAEIIVNKIGLEKAVELAVSIMEKEGKIQALKNPSATNPTE